MRSFIFSVLVVAPATLFAGSIFLEGSFQNKNLYVLNTLSSSGVGYCTYQVLVNGQTTTDEVNSSAFEIDLSSLELGVNEKVAVEIRYKEGCAPKILNPDVLRPKAGFSAKSILLDVQGNLKWTTENEESVLPFVVEQFRWNKWIVVGEVAGKGGVAENDYAFKVTLHSGENKFRVRQTGYNNNSVYSDVVLVKGSLPKVAYTAKNNVVMFSDETLYEVYDYYGTVVKKGFAKTIDLNGLKKGGYYLCYDNVVAEFQKK
jgi:hypothetical protein